MMSCDTFLIKKRHLSTGRKRILKLHFVNAIEIRIVILILYVTLAVNKNMFFHHHLKKAKLAI